MRYTIIDTEKKSLFIQQIYNTIEQAQERLALQQAKLPKDYPIAVVGIDDDGSFHELAEAPTDQK